MSPWVFYSLLIHSGELYHSRQKIYYIINENVDHFKYSSEFLISKELIERAGASSNEILYPPEFVSSMSSSLEKNESFGSILHLFLSRYNFCFQNFPEPTFN
jgi:hypothetical protein